MANSAALVWVLVFRMSLPILCVVAVCFSYHYQYEVWLLLAANFCSLLFTLSLPILCVVAVCFSYHYQYEVWLLLAANLCSLLFTLMGAIRVGGGAPAGLSARAAEHFHKYRGFFAHPFAGARASGDTSLLMYCCVGTGVLGAAAGQYYGAIIAALVWLPLGLMAKRFNPTPFLTDGEEYCAHLEVLRCLEENRRTHGELGQ